MRKKKPTSRSRMSRKKTRNERRPGKVNRAMRDPGLASSVRRNSCTADVERRLLISLLDLPYLGARSREFMRAEVRAPLPWFLVDVGGHPDSRFARSIATSLRP